MSKGEQTRRYILDRGMLYSSQQGLVDLSIGNMAKLCGLSRTGVISHFDNKEHMQVSILKYAERQFVERVIRPCRDRDALGQLRKLVAKCVDWTQLVFSEAATGCPFVKALVDYEHRDGTAVKAVVSEQQNRMLSYLEELVRKAQAHQQIKAELPAHDIAFEIYSIYMGATVASAVQKEGRQALLLRTLQRHTLTKADP